MDVQTLYLPRFLTRRKHHADPQPERVEGVYLQEQSFGIALSGPGREWNEIPAGTVLTEYTCTACTESAAATTLFIP
jgi:hypothetical protein